MSPTYLRGSWAWSSIGLGAPPGPPMVRASRKPRTSHPLLTTTHSSTTRLSRSLHLETCHLHRQEGFLILSHIIRDLFFYVYKPNLQESSNYDILQDYKENYKKIETNLKSTGLSCSAAKAWVRSGDGSGERHWLWHQRYSLSKPASRHTFICSMTSKAVFWCPVCNHGYIHNSISIV